MRTPNRRRTRRARLDDLGALLLFLFVLAVLVGGIAYAVYIGFSNPRCLLAQDVGLCDAMTRETTDA